MKRHLWRESLVLLAGTLLVSCSPVGKLAALPPMTSTQYLLDAGDELRVTAYGLEDFSNNYVISDVGTVSLPLIGDVPAGGQNVGQVQQAIAAKLTQMSILKAPVVNVQVNRYRPFFIVGEVKKPGEYPFRPGTTVLNAVSMAGGYTFRASTAKVAIVRRQGRDTVTASAGDEALIQPGDTIRVFESWF